MVAAGITTEGASLPADHRAMLLELNRLFRDGHLPSAPLDGPYAGRLITTTVGRTIDAVCGALAHVYMPWRGKVFAAADGTGANLFTARSKPMLRPFDPAVRDAQPGLVTAYPFTTHIGAGVIDCDRMVLKIDYNLPANRVGLIRRVLDEVVEVTPGCYLGKAHLHLRGHWRTVAYFALRRQ